MLRIILVLYIKKLLYSNRLKTSVLEDLQPKDNLIAEWVWSLIRYHVNINQRLILNPIWMANNNHLLHLTC